MQNVIELNASPFVRTNVCWFTSCSLADGLTDTVDFACSMAIEEPHPPQTKTPFRSRFVIMVLHRSGIRIQGCLGMLTVLDCRQDDV